MLQSQCRILLYVILFKVYLVICLPKNTTRNEATSSWTISYTGENDERKPETDVEFASVADEFVRTRKFKEAIDYYTKAIEKNNNQVHYYRQRANCYVKLGNLNSAIFDLWKVIRMDENNKADRLTLCHALFNSGKFRQSIDETHAMNDFDELVKLGDKFTIKQMYIEALRCYNLAIQSKPSEAKYYVQKGHCLWAMNEFLEAIVEFTSAVETDPRNEVNRLTLMRALHRYEEFDEIPEETLDILNDSELETLGSEFYSRNRYEEALRCYSEAVKKSPQARYYRSLGLCYWDMQEPFLAALEIQKAVQLDPGNQSNRICLKEALLHCEHFNELPEDVFLYLTDIELGAMGAEFFAKGKLDESLVCYGLAIERNSMGVQYYRGRAQSYWAMHTVDLAISDFQKALELDPTNEVDRYSLCQALLEAERFDEILDEIFGLSDTHLDILADKFFSIEKFLEAIRCYTELLARKVDEATNYNKRGHCFWKKRNLKKAISDMEQAVLIDSGSVKKVSYRIDLSDALVAAGKYEEAEKFLGSEYIDKDRVSAEDTAKLDEVHHKIKEGYKIREQAKLIAYLKQLILDDTERRIRVTSSENLHDRSDEELYQEIKNMESDREKRVEQLAEAFDEYKRHKLGKAPAGTLVVPEVPDYLLDKISFEIMEEPVITPSGVTYEEAAILRHLQFRRTDPTSRRPLNAEQLVPNRAVKHAVELWKRGQ